MVREIKYFLKIQCKKSRLIVYIYRLLRNLKNNDLASLQGQTQKAIESQWLHSIKSNIRIYEDIKDSGFRCYSQFEEDGIILYLLSCIGKKTRSVVELCCGEGRECMSANLIINHGYKGYLFDGSHQNISAANNFFNKQKDCLLVMPKIRQAWITKDNINDLLVDAGIEGEIDVLSLDMDGNDYYIWDAINVINPRICIFEINNIIPTNLELTIPYHDDFYAWDKSEIDSEFRSVSLLAMIKLSEKKGYTMVGSHKHGFNVFFIRNDLLNDLLPRPTIDEISDCEWTRSGVLTRWPLVKNHPWVDLSKDGYQK